MAKPVEDDNNLSGQTGTSIRDPGLTKKGILQAMQLGEEIRQQAGFILDINLPFKTLYGKSALFSRASNYRRCRENHSTSGAANFRL
jgi:broad specificity phosphatase PhoE